MKKPIWYRLPAVAVEDPSISRTALAVLAVLIDQSDGEACELSQAEIAEACGCSERSVRNALKELQARELVGVRHTGRASIYSAAQVIPKKKRGSSTEEVQGQKTFTDDLRSRGERVTVPAYKRPPIRNAGKSSASSFTIADLQAIQDQIEKGGATL